MFCLRLLTLPPPSGCFQSTSPFVLSTHQRNRLSPSATFRKMRSRQTMGVEPLQPGIEVFQTTFSSVVHLTGRFFSLLTPLRLGPRHCGQFCACARANESRRRDTTPRVRMFRSSSYSARSDGNNGERKAASVPTSDAI